MKRYVQSIICILFSALSLLMCYRYGSLNKGAVFAVLFIIVGIINYYTKDVVLEHEGKHIFLGALFIAYAFFTVYVCQAIMNLKLETMGGKRIVLNLCIFFLLSLIIFAISLNYRFAIVLSSGIPALFTTANYYVVKFRGSGIKPTDFLALGTAMNVSVNYSIVPTPRMLHVWILLVLSWTIMFLLIPDVIIENRRFNRIWAFAASIFCACVVFSGASSIQPRLFTNDGAMFNGTILNFLVQIPKMFVSAPEGYSAETLSQLEELYEVLPVQNSDRPDIFVVMDESFADLSVLGSELKTDIEVTPFINSLNQNTVKGNALASVFGGVTPNSEYEFLSGNSMFFLPTGSNVFQQYLDEQPYSLVSYLKGIDYNCIGMHPYYSNGWERQKVYPLLGFDECYFLDDYPREDLIRRFVSDREAFEVMTQRYADHKRESDQNTFMFLVTMQNHGGYTYEGEDFEQTIRLEGYSEDFPDAEQYLSLIHETDDAVSWLVDYLSNLDHKCVLVFFGDHMPALSDSFYIEMHGGEYTYLDEEELKRSVPFFVWTNYDIENEPVELTSLNYLSKYMFEAAGIELPAYNKFLADVEEEIPAINALGYYSKSEGRFKTYEEALDEEAKLLNTYHQFVYNCLFDKENRNSFFFPRLNQDH